MAQSLLTQRGVEYGSTMRSLQAIAAKKHPPKKWRSRNQSRSESSSSSSDSCSSSGSDGEGSSSRSSATAEREFSIVKESNFANAPLKLKIAARRIKKAQEVANGNFDQEDISVESPPQGSDLVRNDAPCKNIPGLAKCSGALRERTQRCKRKIEKKRCLQTKDTRVICSGQYPSCKASRKTRRCSTSGSSSSSSSSGSSSGSSASSSSGSSTGSSTGCSSSTGSSSSGSSSTSGSSSSSSSSSRSSSGSESESCCSASNYTRCRRRRKNRRKTSIKCQANCTLQCKKPQNICESSRGSFSNSQSLTEKVGFGKGGKRITNECSRNKKLQVSDIDYFTISSSDENCSTEDKNASIQECFSMWRKVEEKHCAIIGDTPGNGELQMQVLSVTNAEVECNINLSNNVGLLNDEKHFLVNTKCENQNVANCDFNFHSLEQLPSIIKGHVTVATTSLDLDALPVSLSNVSPDSGIQSSGDSPLRVDCEITTCGEGNQTLVSLVDEYYEKRDSSEVSNKFNNKQGKSLSPAHSPPVLIPHDPVWTSRISEPQTVTEIHQKSSDEDCAPFLVQEGIEVKLKGTSDLKIETMYNNYKEIEFTSIKELLPNALRESVNQEESKSNSMSTNSNSNDLSTESKESNTGAFSQNPLHLMFNDQSLEIEKTDSSVFSEQSSQLTSSSETRRPRARTPRRFADTKADNELHLLVQSVQDSISSQFQSVESDELSDVDVNSIPVTALTCDTTSDSFCDKLSNEANIDILLNDRTCIHDSESSSKQYDSPASNIGSDNICVTNTQKSNELSNNGFSVTNTTSNNDSKMFTEIHKLSPETYNISDSVFQNPDKNSINCIISISEEDNSNNVFHNTKKLDSNCSDAIPDKFSSVKITSDNDLVSCSPMNCNTENDIVVNESIKKVDECIETPSYNHSNIVENSSHSQPINSISEKKGRGRPRKYPKINEISKSTPKVSSFLEVQNMISSSDFVNDQEKQKSFKTDSLLDHIENKNLTLDEINETNLNSVNKSNSTEKETSEIILKKRDNEVLSSCSKSKSSHKRSNSLKKETSKTLKGNDSKKMSKRAYPKSIIEDDYFDNNEEFTQLINTPVIITDDKEDVALQTVHLDKMILAGNHINEKVNESFENKCSLVELSPSFQKESKNRKVSSPSKRKNFKTSAKEQNSISEVNNLIENEKHFDKKSTVVDKNEDHEKEIMHNANKNVVSNIRESLPAEKSDLDFNSSKDSSKLSAVSLIDQKENHTDAFNKPLDNLIDNKTSEINYTENFQSHFCPSLKPKSNKGRKSKKKKSSSINNNSLISSIQSSEIQLNAANISGTITSVDSSPISCVENNKTAITGNPKVPNDEKSQKTKIKKSNTLNESIPFETLSEADKISGSPEKINNSEDNLVKPLRSQRIRDSVAKKEKKESFKNVDAVINEVIHSGAMSKEAEALDTLKLDVLESQPELNSKLSLKKKTKKSLPIVNSHKETKISTLSVDKNLDLCFEDNKSNPKQETTSQCAQEISQEIDLPIKHLELKSSSKKDNSAPVINNSSEKPRKRKTVSASEELVNDPTLKSKCTLKKCEKRKASDSNDKDASLSHCSAKTPEKSDAFAPKTSLNHELVDVIVDKQNKKLNSKFKTFPKKTAVNCHVKNVAKMQNSKQKMLTCKAKIESKSKRQKVVKESFNEKLRSGLSNKAKAVAINRGVSISVKDSDSEDLAGTSQISPKVSKKDVKKSKVDEEKENLDVRKEKFSPKTKAKQGKDYNSQKLCDDSKKSYLHGSHNCKQVEFLEKDSASSLSLKEDIRMKNAIVNSDAGGSCNIEKSSSFDTKPLKKKRSAKLYYSDDPSFSRELDILAELLESCCISKKRTRLKDDSSNTTLPSVFKLNFCLGKETRSRLNNKIAKEKVKIIKKKPKRLVKAKNPSKILTALKSKVPVSENCLPLKKRRHITPNPVLNSKVTASETTVVKSPGVKRTFTLANSFDETIEECIRKHMMTDAVQKDKNFHSLISKPKPKNTKLRDSIDEAIDSCIKNNLLCVKDDKTVEETEKKLEEETENIPLASLVASKKKKPTVPASKPKPVESALAYRQKRKRLIKEACAQSVKISENTVDTNINAQKKRRRFRNKTGFVRVKKKKTRIPVNNDVVEPAEVVHNGEVIDLTSEDTMLDAIESVVKASVETESSRSRRKRKNVAQKCEIEVLDLTSGNDDNDVECLASKKQKSTDEELEPKYQQIIQVTEPSSGRRSAPVDPRKIRRKEIHFHKKKFLRAGLYSAHFKLDCPVPKKTSSKKSRSREVKEYIPEDHEFGLMPPPIHVGRYLREKRNEYKLPYDIWWLYKNKQLVYNDELSNNYKKIRTNVYVDIKPDSKCDDQSCNCVPPKDHRRRGCGTECLNRMMYVECTPNMCPCKDLCSNQRIFKHEWSPGLERFMTRDRGWGIRTTEFIRAGEFILEYVGEVVSDTEFRHRMAERYRNDQHHYCLSLDSGTVIDGYRLAGEGRFVNHSCEPNCEMQKWYVNGHYRVGLFSMRDIFPNTELCYDYNFVNYNLETQQICRCGSSKCRGFIGGRSQRVNGQNKEKVRQVKSARAIVDSKKGPGRPKKRKDEKPVEIQKERIKNEYLDYNRQSFTIQMKPMSHQQRCYVQKHHCFLLRNFEKVKKAKDEARIIAEKEAERENAVNSKDAFLTQFTALNTARSVKTRRLAIVEENPELTQTAKLAQVFKDIFTAVTSCKGDDGVVLASPFLQLPSKKKNQAYYSKIKFPIDFSVIEKNILTGQYTSVEAFEDDFLRLFENAEEFYGRTSDFGHKISLLRKAYEAAKTDAMIMFEDILGDAMSSVFTSSKDDAKTDEDDEVIRCICNIYKDEGLVIQCEKCLVWQHCDCIGVDGKVEKYLCEQCSGIELSKEILMIPRPHYATDECQYYLTMLLNSLQIKQGDCVYLKPDGENASQTSNESIEGQILAQGVEKDDAVTRDSLRTKKAEQLDIFRVERLWKDEHNNKFAFGHHYLRPHETYHEPSRKFFPNEVFRVPLYEIIPLDSIVGLCCVLDLPTFCKGRPKGFKEDDTYICDYRVDKSARLFYKISKIKYPTCTKKYAFDYFDKKRNPKRTFLPHAVPNNYQKKCSSERASVSTKKVTKPETQNQEKKKRGAPKEIGMRLEESPETREKKRVRLNELLQKFLDNMPCKQTIDLSYLLEGGLGKRIRRKTNLSSS